MKNFINSTVFMFLFLVAMQLSATVITVDNNAESGAQFTDLQAAIDAASPGDTVLVAGSQTEYGQIITIKKKLHLMGAGYFVTETQNNFTAKANFSIARTTLEDASGTIVEGFQGSVSISGNSASNRITNVRVYRIHGDVSVYNASGVKIYNNIISSFRDQGGCSNIAVVNNIFRSSSVIVSSFNYEVIIANNLFTIGVEFQGQKFFATNNISLGNVSTLTEYVTYNNNLFVKDDGTSIVIGNNTGADNVINNSPVFVDLNTSTGLSDPNNIFKNDFRLADNSPFKDFGTDGTDLGIFGGDYPFPLTGREAPNGYATSPAIPQILEMNLANANVPKDGTIKVMFKARINN